MRTRLEPAASTTDKGDQVEDRDENGLIEQNAIFLEGVEEGKKWERNGNEEPSKLVDDADDEMDKECVHEHRDEAPEADEPENVGEANSTTTKESKTRRRHFKSRQRSKMWRGNCMM